MMGRLIRRLARFRKEENGQMLIEFALVIPLVFTIFMSSVELAMYQYRQFFLDRGMDLTVRQIRLNTGADYTHQQLKVLICDFSGLAEDCEGNLKLELQPVALRGFSGFTGGSADCTDASQPVTPSRTFKHGDQHEMMLMRACFKFRPVFKSSGLGYNFATTGDDAGMAKMVSVSAFVQEPG